MEFNVKQKYAETKICSNFLLITCSEPIKLLVRGIQDSTKITILLSLFLHTELGYFVNGQKKDIVEFGLKCR